MARAFVIFKIDVSPFPCIDEAIAEHNNSLLLVGGNIAATELSETALHFLQDRLIVNRRDRVMFLDVRHLLTHMRM